VTNPDEDHGSVPSSGGTCHPVSQIANPTASTMHANLARASLTPCSPLSGSRRLEHHAYHVNMKRTLVRSRKTYQKLRQRASGRTLRVLAGARDCCERLEREGRAQEATRIAHCRSVRRRRSKQRRLAPSRRTTTPPLSDALRNDLLDTSAIYAWLTPPTRTTVPPFGTCNRFSTAAKSCSHTITCSWNRFARVRPASRRGSR